MANLSNSALLKARQTVNNLQASTGSELVGHRESTSASILDSVPTPLSYNIRGDGSDETTAINAYLAGMTSIGYPARFDRNLRYGITGLIVPDNCVIDGNDAEFVFLGSTNTGFSIGKHCQVNNLRFTSDISPGTCYIGEGSTAKLSLTSPNEVGGTIYIHPSASYVDLEAENILYPFFIRNWELDYSGEGVAPLGGHGLRGLLKARTYRRALRADASDYFDLKVDFQYRDSQAASDPGHNGILINGCSHFKISGIVQGSGEHCVRFGSSGIKRESTDWYFGDLLVGKSGGCGFKINPDKEYPCRRGYVNSLLGVDVGLDASDTGRNDEFIRISSAFDITFNYAKHEVIEMPNVISGVRISEGENITFNYLDAGPCGEYIRFVEEGDTSGPINNFRVLDGKASPSASGAIQFQREVNPTGNVYIKSSLSGSFSYYSQGHTSSTTLLSGPIHFDIRIAPGSAAGTRYFLNTDDVTARITIDTANRTYEGHVNGRVGGSSSFNTPVFDPSNIATSNYSMVLGSMSSTSAQGNYSAALEFIRPGEARRGGAVALQQVGTTAFQTGISFFTGAGVQASNILRNVGVLRFDGLLDLNYGAAGGSGVIFTEPDGSRYILRSVGGSLTLTPE